MIKILKHRQVPEGYRLKSVTVTKRRSGRYYVSILYEYEENIEIVEEPEKILGLDYSMRELYMDSNGEVPEFPHYYRKAEAKLAKEQRKLSKMQKGGENYKKQKRKIAKLHEHIANQRKDFLHKLSRQITNDYDMVVIEDLNMKGMSQSLNFGKTVSDNGWGMFTRMLEYKLKEQGKELIRIDKWYPSSKTCHHCGTKNDKLTLSDREWTCECCGTHHERDMNAAMNIRDEGIRVIQVKKLTA
jgi:putative transposase